MKSNSNQILPELQFLKKNENDVEDKLTLDLLNLVNESFLEREDVEKIMAAISVDEKESFVTALEERQKIFDECSQTAEKNKAEVLKLFEEIKGMVSSDLQRVDKKTFYNKSVSFNKDTNTFTVDAESIVIGEKTIEAKAAIETKEDEKESVGDGKEYSFEFKKSYKEALDDLNGLKNLISRKVSHFPKLYDQELFPLLDKNHPSYISHMKKNEKFYYRVEVATYLSERKELKDLPITEEFLVKKSNSRGADSAIRCSKQYLTRVSKLEGEVYEDVRKIAKEALSKNPNEKQGDLSSKKFEENSDVVSSGSDDALSSIATTTKDSIESTNQTNKGKGMVSRIRAITANENQRQIEDAQRRIKQLEEEQEKLQSFKSSSEAEKERAAEEAQRIAEQLSEIQNQIKELANIASRSASLKDAVSNMEEKFADFDPEKIPTWIKDLNLKSDQVDALNKLEGFQIEQLQDLDLQEIFSEIDNSRKEFFQFKTETQKQLKEKFAAAMSNPNSVVAQTTKRDPRYKDYLEQGHLETKDENVKTVASAIEAKFNEHFMVSSLLKSNKIQGKQGKAAKLLGMASGLIGDLPFGGIVGSAATNLADYLGGKNRENRYQNLSEFLGNSSMQDAAMIAEKIARKVALTEEVQILAKTKTPKELEAYKENLAKSCLETILSGAVDVAKIKETKIDPTSGKDWRDLVIERVINENKEIKNKQVFYLDYKQVNAAVTNQPPSNDQIIAMFEKMQQEMFEMRSEIEDLKKTVAEQNREIYDLKKEKSVNQRPPSSISPKSRSQLDQKQNELG